jgi:hypothetical protein
MKNLQTTTEKQKEKKKILCHISGSGGDRNKK